MKERIFIKRAKEHVQLEQWLREQFRDVRCGQIEIHYTPLGVRIIIHTTSPGLVIGPGGEKIREVTEHLRAKFGLESPQIDVQKIENPDLDPRVVAQTIASSLERNVNYKRLGKFTVERIMRAGAIGCEIVIGGKLGGEKSRSERFAEGYLKKCGEPALRDVIRGFSVTTTKMGNVGIQVSIMIQHSDKKIIVKRPEGELEAAMAKIEEAKPKRGRKKKADEVLEREISQKEEEVVSPEAVAEANTEIEAKNTSEAA